MMTTSVQHPRRGLHLRPTSRVTWLGLALLLLSAGGFLFSVMTWDALLLGLGPDDAAAVRGIVARLVIELAGAAAPIVLAVAVIARGERSVGGLAGIVLAVLWILFLQAMTRG